MKKNYWIGLLFFLFFSVGTNVNAQFTQGRLVVLQVGDGTAVLSNAATPIFLKEFTNTGTAGIIVNVPTTGSNRLTISGSAGSDGQMTLSQDGKFITIACYDAASGTASVTSSTSASTNRVINSVDASGTVVRVATTNSVFSANNFRSAVKGNNTDYWGAGGNSGTYYFGTTATAGAIQTTTANTRVVNIFNGNLYYSTGSGTIGVYGFTGTPTASSTPSLLIGTGTGSSPYSFAINPSGTIAYIADDRASASAGGVQRWNFNGSSWTFAYTLNSGATIGARGLAVDFSGTNPIVYATTTDNKLIRYTDTGASSTATTLFTAPTNTALRGLTFAPSNPVIPPSITKSGTLNSVNTTYGTASAIPTNFTVSGSNLTNDIIITPPTAYEISKTVGGTSGYAATQTLTQTAGSVASTIIYVRLKADATVAGSPYSGNIVLSSTGASSVNVPTVSSTISPKELTITGLTADNKTYDGNTTASFSGTPAYNGLENGEIFSVSGTATASFATATVGNVKPVSVTGYTAPSTNYTLSQPTLSANITPAILTISSAATSNKIYDGNNSATITGTLSGVIGSETVTLNLSGTFSQVGVGTALPVTSTSTITGIDAGNYSLTQPTGLTADITAKPLTITGLSANNKVFDGTTTATLSGTAILNGIVVGDEPNVTLAGTPTATFAQSSVGNGIAITVTGYSLTGSISGNYTVSQPTGLTADITNLPTPNINSPLTASATYGVASTSYFITATNSPTSFNATGLPTGLSINTSTGEISGTPTDVAGSPFSVTISATNLGGTGTATLVYTVSPKALTITSPSVPNKVYDRTNVAIITGTLSGIVGIDVVTLNGTGTFSQSTVGSGLAVTSTSTLSGADASKYTLTQPTGLTGTIVIKPLTVSGASVSSKVYDGNSTATLTGATLNGILSPDVVTLTGGAIFTTVDVGNNISINTSSLTLGGADAGNYIALPIIGLTGNITPKQLTISGLSVSNKVYDGNTNATLTGTATLNGIIGTDDVSISGTATATFNNKNLGISKPMTVSGYALTGTKSGNYTFSQPTGLTANITPLALTVTNPIAQNKPFDGNTNATITGTLSGVISPDVVTFIGTGTFASSAVGNGIAVTSISTLGGADAGNYTLTQPTGLTANITGPPTIIVDVATTTNYLDGGILTSPTSPYSISGVINDPTDPAKTLGIDFTINDANVPVANLTVTATSSNLSVVPNANLNLTGSGASRNLKITSIAEGFSTITVTVNNGSSTASYSINYASSLASTNVSTTRFHTGTADASTAQMIDNNLMLVGDDENQALRMYDRNNSGLPVNSFNFTTSLGLTDISGGNPREVDIEASAKVGNRIYWMGSHSNSSGGGNRPNRSRFFATDITGTGNATTLSYIGRYDNLKSDLLAWDANNGHGLGANFLGLTASAATGKAPEIADGSGFNIEGFEIAPNNTTAYICFRAPLQTTSTRTKALIIPLTNFANLVSGNPTSTTATFGTPIQLDLGGRAIREIKKNAAGEYLIIAGPNDGATGIAPKDFRFYTWTGNPTDSPILRSANLTALNSNGSFESIVDLPSPLLSTSNLQVLVDNGDAIFYGNGIIAKDLPQNNHKKFRSETINLGTESLLIGSISGTSFCENASISIPFTTTETFNTGNVFTAQLSNSTGSFANPVSIGTLTGTSAGTIVGTIPTVTATGSGYRIRVVSSNLAIVSKDNGVNLTINNCTPLATIKSITTGNWESTSTWDLGRVPQAGDLVIIDQNHEVTLNGTGTAKRIEYQGTGKLKLSSIASILNTGL